MNSETLQKLKYPIGKFEWVVNLPISEVKTHINTIRHFPVELEQVLDSCKEELLQKKYRPEGWTIAQVVHHLADSHAHSYLRFKHAVLEDTPHIKDYTEADWANLPDAATSDLKPSLMLIKGIHMRWSLFLDHLKEEDFKKVYFHPERNKNYPLDTTTALYAWHCNHHLAHINNTIRHPYE